jgi:hypothetical protein
VVLGLSHAHATQRLKALADAPRKLLVGVDAGADGSAAERNLGELGAGVLQTRKAALYLAGVAAELLAQPDGGGVLQVGAAGLDDGPELVRLGVERPPELLEGGGEVFADG